MNDYVWPDYIRDALSILKPPEKLTVSEWADKYRVLDELTSAEPGKWNTMRTPYLKQIMDDFTNPDVSKISFVKCTQVGGTECINNMIGYIIAQDPSATLVVYPTTELAEFTAKVRLKNMIYKSDVLKTRYLEDKSTVKEMQFQGMFLSMAGANSPTPLSSKPIRFVFMDEIDKYPKQSRKEADPKALAEERTKTYPNSKIVEASTPTFKNDGIWAEWEAADKQFKNFVVCPHCGHKFVFKFKDIKWTGSTADEVYKTARYICENCENIITDANKIEMVRVGEWIDIKNGTGMKVAYHLNAMYSPWIRFGDVARKYFESKDDPALLQNFVNSWLGEPWERTEIKLDSDAVLERQSNYEELEIPDGTQLITGGVDVQKDHMYYTIRAWGEAMTSWNISHGIAETWDQVEFVMNSIFEDRQGNQYQVAMYLVDSGYNSDEVYQFCAFNNDCAAPAKGSSTPLTTRYKRTIIDKNDSVANGLSLYIIDGAQYKDMITSRMKRPNGTGSWMVFKNCDVEYAEQIVAEEKITVKKNGKECSEWKLKTSHGDNHYLDCEVYAACAADLCGVRYLNSLKKEEKSDKVESDKRKNIENEYLKEYENFLNIEGGWLDE